jgi:endonuclease I
VASFTGSIIHASGSADQQSLSVSGSGVSSFIPGDYYATATDAGSRLKTQLHHIISNHHVQSYASLWTHFATTDATFDGAVWDIYSYTLCEEPPYTYVFFDDQDSGTGGTAEGDVYNREHTMPRSWFGGQVDPMNTDLYHIYPSDKWVNARRAAFPYGMVDNAGWTSLVGGKLGPNVAGGYSGTAFEPVDEYKGDLARAFFYMVTRYEDRISNWTYSEYGNAMLDHQTYPGFKPWVIQMLVNWHESDPVSQKEVLRNRDVYQIQGNRNPFVDHPEFVPKIWGDTTVYAGNLPVAPRITMYPNPAGEFLSIETPGEAITLQVFNASGELVLSMTTPGTLVRLDVKHWSTGVYVLRIQGTVWTETRRIIIL